MSDTYRDRARARLARRHRAEARFRWLGRGALTLAAGILLVLLISLMIPGVKGLIHAEVLLKVPNALQESELPPSILVKRTLKARFQEVTSRSETLVLYRLLAPHADRYVPENVPRMIEVPLSSEAGLWIKAGMEADTFEEYGISKQQAQWLKQLEADGQVDLAFDSGFFTNPDSREPEKAGLAGSIVGSLLVIAVCLAVSLPVGVAAAIYLQEFAKPGRLNDLIEVNINNLAAIPSIIYGLLGLFLFLEVLGLPRSSALVGGLTLSLMTLPLIIIATRSALMAVPDSLRDAARGMGASSVQVVTHHVLPQALPGIMTGTILGIARALGETAPLLMIGMVAFIASVPDGVAEPATVMPVQIYLWSSSPEQGFVERTASGILVLIVILLCMNLLATLIRSRSEAER